MEVCDEEEDHGGCRRRGFHVDGCGCSPCRTRLRSHGQESSGCHLFGDGSHPVPRIGNRHFEMFSKFRHSVLMQGALCQNGVPSAVPACGAQVVLSKVQTNPQVPTAGAEGSVSELQLGSIGAARLARPVPVT